MTEEKQRFTLKIFHKILLTMIVVALIPLAGLMYIGGYQIEENWRQNANLNLTLTANGLVGKVNGWVDMNLRVLRENATLPDIVSMDPVRQQPILKAIENTYEWVYLSFTAKGDGQSAGRSDDNPTQNYADRNYFKQVMAGKPLGQDVVIGKTSQKPALILAAPIHAAGTAKPVAGVMAIAMQLVDVSQVVTGTKIGATGFAVLVDDKNRVIAHGKPEKVASALQDFSAHPALRRTESAQEPAIYEEEDRRVVVYTQKTALGWTLMVQQDYDDAFGPLLEARKNALLLIALALLLVIAVAFALSRQLSNPIVQLTEVAENISRGNFETPIVGAERLDELGALARAIDRMAVSIKMAFERLRRKS